MGRRLADFAFAAPLPPKAGRLCPQGLFWHCAKIARILSHGRANAIDFLPQHARLVWLSFLQFLQMAGAGKVWSSKRSRRCRLSTLLRSRHRLRPSVKRPLPHLNGAN